MSPRPHPAVFVYVSCSLTKRAEAGEHLELGTIASPHRGDSLSEVMQRWQRAIDRIPETGRVRAIDLYGGGIWADLRKNHPDLKAAGVEIRIVSAGLGLLTLEEKVPAYDATFAPGAENAIGGERDAVQRNRDWWGLLGDWPSRPGLRTIYATVKAYPRAAHLIALPLDYMDAVLEDLQAVWADEIARDQMVVLISPYASVATYARTVRVPGDLYGALGGTRGTVLARAGFYVASELKSKAADPEAVKSALHPLHAKAKPLPVRSSQSDEKVLHFIRRAMEKDASLSHSRLLAQFRQAGYACERRRFKAFHKKIKSSL